VLLVALICTSQSRYEYSCDRPNHLHTFVASFHVSLPAPLSTYRHKTFHFYVGNSGAVCIQNIRYVGKTFYGVACAFLSGFGCVRLCSPSGFVWLTSWEDLLICAFRPVPNFEGQGEGGQTNATKTEWLDTYDYIVVGSGPGGSPLASRLAIAGFKALMIEAGDDQGDALLQQIPYFHAQSTEYEPMQWDYFVSHHDNTTLQLEDSKMTWENSTGGFYVGDSPPAGSSPLGILYPRAGTLGGCAAHNAMITILPQDSDWNNLATITGDNSWASSNMRKYFERLESNHYELGNTTGHGYNGYLGTSLIDLGLTIGDPQVLSLIVAAGAAACEGLFACLWNTVRSLGQVLLRDLNSDDPSRDSTTGLYRVPMAVNDSKRSSPREFLLNTANAVNDDGSRKYHLDIRLNTLVTRVRFTQDTATPKAVGVDFLDGQSLYRADPRARNALPSGAGSVNATREVIISAGVFNTPQLLKLSGIGPQAELESFNIPIVANLPGVGTNLQDRYEATIIGKSDISFTGTSSCTFLATDDDPCLEQWQTNSADPGIYATNGRFIANVMKSSTVVEGGDPDLFVSGRAGYFSGYYPGYSKPYPDAARIWTWVTLKAHSRNNAGTVTLRSADPRDVPQINFRSFAGPGGDQDLQAVYEGMQYSRQIFQSLNQTDGQFVEIWPGADVQSEEQLKDFIQREAWGHHASCTCPIGADDDPMAVLDGNFNVRGVSGLRVVDASAFAKIPGYYIAASIYMISEKAADVIIADAM
jgi:choline dehydrogenase